MLGIKYGSDRGRLVTAIRASAGRRKRQACASLWGGMCHIRERDSPTHILRVKFFAWEGKDLQDGVLKKHF